VIQREQLNAELRERISSWSREPLLSALQIAGVPAGPIHRVSEALSLPQALALRLDKDGIRGMRTFLGIVGKKRVDLSAPPHFNEHHAEIEASFFKK
jgi:crotonobetainyl-CoA:carnitine CoA-transferase CaiB-like acyl-CoA transferase